MSAPLRLPPLPTIRDLIRLYKIRALKQLSQNFLMEERLTDKIVRAAGKIEGSYVCEVGPGPGSITRSILRRNPKKLILVEKDPRFVPTLELLKEATEGHVDVSIEIDDILSYNLEYGFQGCWKKDWEDHVPQVHLIGNLPFNVSTILLIKWLNFISIRKSAWLYGRTPMTLTFQREVAERIVASVTDKQRCRLSVMCQFWTDPTYRFVIPGKAFVPKPDVDVGVVHLVPKRQPLVDLPFSLVEKLVRTIFNTRQKYSHKGACKLFPPEDREAMCVKLFQLADVDSTARPFQITNEEFARLCYAYKALCNEFPFITAYNFRASKFNTTPQKYTSVS